jgi:lipid-A-disaccharide synthase
LLDGLREANPEVETLGMGGPRMKAAGFHALRDSGELNVMGLVEVLRHLPRLLALKDALADAAIEAQPDVAVLIDAPDFHIRLAKRLKAAGIPVVFYVGPSVWAGRPRRVKHYQPWIDRLLVLFPFEEPIWKAADVDVQCVGHPLVDEVPEAASTELQESKTVALLPGSRLPEIRRHLGITLEAGKRLVDEDVVERFVLPVAPTLHDAAWVSGFIEQARLQGRGSSSGRGLADCRSLDIVRIVKFRATMPSRTCCS